MSRRTILISVAGGLAALVVGCALYAYYHLNHILTTVQVPSSALIALKGALGEAILSGQQQHAELIPPDQLNGKTDLHALLASAPASNKGQGLIADYQKDPQKFKRYADMLDTALSAKQVGDAVLHEGGAHPPRTSEPLAIADNLKADAWGSPFCIIPVGRKVAVVSGGPSRLSCNALPLTPQQIAKSNRAIYAGPSDIVVVIELLPQQNMQ